MSQCILCRAVRACLPAVTVAFVLSPPICGQDVKVFHPAGPMPSYEVATIKPANPDQSYGGITLRRYIAGAYGIPSPWGVPGYEYSGSQVAGGPAWIEKDRYEIKGKPADELRDAMERMSRDDRAAQNRMMQQSLLAERFHLKVHFETREMPVFELIPAKGGLKFKPVDPPPSGSMKPYKAGEPMPPGTTSLSVMLNGVHIINAMSTTIEGFCNAIRGEAPEIAGRPIMDMTGFSGNFDLRDFRFLGAPLRQAGSAASEEPDAPSVFQALEQQLGMKLLPAKGQVEIVVIDSIERPTEN